MFDRDTLIIAYDEKRGEPRKSAAKKSGAAAGDCVDCSMCVQVCPMGIDIRKGLQYECIACAACVDACNSVMDSVEKPRGLIHYTSARHDETGRFHILRPRMIGYGVVWAAACVGFMVLVLNHSLLRFDVLRDRHALYRELADGAIENVYTFKITNDDVKPHRFVIKARFADGTPLIAEPAEVEVKASETTAATVALRTAPRAADAAELPMVEDVDVELEALDEGHLERSRSARFLTGGKS
jgi:cytochrome c oxidase accessory protein FixG